jgi:hypothetical protein
MFEAVFIMVKIEIEDIIFSTTKLQFETHLLIHFFHYFHWSLQLRPQQNMNGRGIYLGVWIVSYWRFLMQKFVFFLNFVCELINIHVAFSTSHISILGGIKHHMSVFYISVIMVIKYISCSINLKNNFCLYIWE